MTPPHAIPWFLGAGTGGEREGSQLPTHGITAAHAWGSRCPILRAWMHGPTPGGTARRAPRDPHRRVPLHTHVLLGTEVTNLLSRPSRGPPHGARPKAGTAASTLCGHTWAHGQPARGTRARTHTYIGFAPHPAITLCQLALPWQLTALCQLPAPAPVTAQCRVTAEPTQHNTVSP